MSSLGCGCFKNFLLRSIQSVSFSLHHGRHGSLREMHARFENCKSSSSSDSFIRLLPRKREREKEGSAIEIGDGQSASSTAAAANDDDNDDDADITGAWAASKEALQFFARNRLHFHGGAKQKTFPQLGRLRCCRGRGAGPLRDMSYGFKEFKVAAEESQKGDPKVLAYRGTPKHPLE